ncbi:hypothetical protein M2132_001290 [Dysgonomonas sp. PH5-45]|uniref:carboxypeptidase regulatory-like domain-containing protein n=1 Tax=unclassified Dysgonomonas TaxID=2630389 RepID=UPI0024742317|nr:MULTISPECIES: carboxypeptidase regulatory-like domain-containing protein [unclassified Dysgonomonas]MDH6354955.1 hypothetical protein [Dysgonomonas sp. PH5-45]MDH6387854.1 hypothetical protein [Dysgonomonas sp. PH5-37]
MKKTSTISLLFLALLVSLGITAKFGLDQSEWSESNSKNLKRTRSLHLAEPKMYGYCSDPGSDYDQVRGFMSFYSSTLDDVGVINGDNTYPLQAGEYYNGRLYAQTLAYSSDLQSYLVHSFVSINPETGRKNTLSSIADGTLAADTKRLVDMAYSYKDDVMYSLVRRETGPTLVTVKLSGAEAGNTTDIGTISGGTPRYVTLACHISGQLYAIGEDGFLYTINIDDLRATKVGDTGIRGENGVVQNIQTMAFDHNTNTLYWACEDGNFYNIEYQRTGRARLLGKTAGMGAHLTCLFSKFEKVNDKVPGIVNALTVTTDGQGGTLLQWINPSETAQGEDGVTLTSVKVYKNGNIVHTINNPQPGIEESWTDTDVKDGDHTYKVVAENSHGVGVPSSVVAVVGLDVPRPVRNISIDKNTAGNAVVEWNVPIGGVNGGRTGSLTYEIVRLPDNKTVATNLTELTFTDTEVLPLEYYKYKVVAVNARDKSTAVTSGGVVLGAASIPWSDDLNHMEKSYTFWTGIDYNGYMWQWGNSNQNYDGGFWYFNPTYIGIDDWLITPPLKLEGGKTYRMRWSESSLDAASHTYTIYMGRKNEPGFLTTKVGEGGVQSYSPYRRDILLPVQSKTNAYHIGFHSYSVDKTMAYIFMDDFMVEEVKDIDLTVYDIAGPPDVSVDLPINWMVTVKNFGKKDATNFKVSIYDKDDKLLGTSDTYSRTLKFDETVEIPVTWKPQAPANRQAVVKAVVSITGDENTANDSYERTVRIYSTGRVKLSPNNYFVYQGFYGSMPFDFSKKASATQTIFTPEEIRMYGTINALRYTTMSKYDVNMPVKIYMAMTDKEDLSDWLREGATLVYSGNINVPKTDSPKDIWLTLDKPYLYDNKNLVIWTERVYNDVVFPEDSVLFLSGKTVGTNKIFQTATWSGDEEFKFQNGDRKYNYAFLEMDMDVNGNALFGKVTDGSNPVGDVSVKINDTDYETVTDAQGNYRFNFVPKGDYTVTYYKKGYREQAKTYTISYSSAVTGNVALEVASDIKITGKILKGAGEALPKAFVSVTSDKEKLYAFANENGEFSIENLSSNKTYNLSVSYSGYAGHTEQITLDDEDKVLSDITLSKCSSARLPKNPTYTTGAPTWYSVKLTWEAPQTESSIRGYRVYRNDELITYELITDKTFVEEVAAGQYTYEVTTVLLNNCESERALVGTVQVELNDCDVAFTNFPLKESFDSGKLSNCWRQEHVSGIPCQWTFTKGNTYTIPSAPHSGEYYIRMVDGGKGAKARLITPKMDITGLSAPVLTYWHAQSLFMASQDYLRVYYKNTPDGEWILLKEYDGNIKDWTEAIHELPNPTDTYWIAFEGQFYAGSGVALDDVRVLDNVCQPVNNLRYEQETEKSVKLLWDTPDAFDVSSYTIIKDGQVIKDNYEGTTYTDENLSIGNYTYQVIAKYKKTGCSQSAATSLQVTVGKVCDPVRNLKLAIASENSIKITWDAPNTTAIASYTVVDNKKQDVATVPAGTTEYTVSDLSEATYRYGVKVNYSSGDCTESDVVFEDINLFTSPVRNFKVKAEYNNKVTLTWDMRRKTIASFNIYRDGVLLENTREQEFIERDLGAGHTYNYCVEAVYDAGWTSTTECGDAALECLEVVDPAVSLSGSVAQLSWSIPDEPEPTRSDLLWDNGAFITHYGKGFNGADVSALNNGGRATGFLVDKLLGNVNTDDFTLRAKSHIGEMEFYAFQKAAPLDGSPILAAYVAIYDGNPANGGVCLWGDYMSNNVLESTDFMNAFRSKIEELGIVDFPIYKVRVKIDKTFPAGKYWVAISLAGNTMYGSPFCIPVTIMGGKDTGDAYIFAENNDNQFVWKPCVDPGHGGTLGLAFKVFGQKNGGTYKVYRDGVLIAEDVEGNSYTDSNVPQGDHKWEIVRVCGMGESGKAEAQTSSIGEEVAENVRIYPNPAKTTVTVEGLNVGRIDVLNTVGQTVKAIECNGENKQTVNVSNLAPGMYIFKLYATNGRTVVKNVIVIK